MRSRTHWRSTLLVTGLVVALVAAGCSSSDEASPAGGGRDVAVRIHGFAFDPSQLQLKAGEKVTFVVQNDDKVEHNLTIDGLKVNTDVSASKSAKASATAAAGTYSFHCEYHPQMTGTVTVA